MAEELGWRDDETRDCATQKKDIKVEMEKSRHAHHSTFE